MSGALTPVVILAGAALCLPLLGLLLPALLPDRPVRAWEVALLFVGPVYGVVVGAVLRGPRGSAPDGHCPRARARQTPTSSVQRQRPSRPSRRNASALARGPRCTVAQTSTTPSGRS